MRPIIPKALVLTGYGLNCDYETDFALKLAGAESHRIHINELIHEGRYFTKTPLEDYHLLVLGGGFSWGDDHGAGVLMASKLRNHLGDQIEQFIDRGKLILGICNGFQCLANLGLLPGFEFNYLKRQVAVTYNDSGNFINAWVKLRVNPESPCIYTKGLSSIDLPVRHGEGKFYASCEDTAKLLKENQVVIQYAKESGEKAHGQWPYNPNGSIEDIAGICDPSGRIFGLMPHPEAFNHFTNHPDWTQKKEILRRRGQSIIPQTGDGIRVFENAIDYIKRSLISN